ncbi:MAG: hypothetical protein IJ105_04335 [Bacilli bacterium]|nr:hypothetical protein [Bacilli bacterium]
MKDNNLKKYRAYIVNDKKLDIMLIDGVNKNDVRDKIKILYFKTDRVKDYRKFKVFVVRVVSINSEYIDME